MRLGAVSADREDRRSREPWRGRDARPRFGDGAVGSRRAQEDPKQHAGVTLRPAIRQSMLLSREKLF